MEKIITVDKNKCIHCGACIKDCLFSCIEFDENKIPRHTSSGKTACIACQHCMAICPVGALSFGNKNPNDSSKASYGNPNELLDLIKSRKSIRQYKNENVPQEKLSKIKEMLSYAPTGCNVNNLHFSIIETKEKMKEIIDLTYKEILNSKDDIPLFDMCRESYKKGLDIIYRGTTSMVISAINKEKTVAGCETTDPIIALSYLDLYAQSLGLGTLWCDMALFSAQQFASVRSLLEIPEGYDLGYILLLGVPDVKYQRTVQPEQFSITLVK